MESVYNPSKEKLQDRIIGLFGEEQRNLLDLVEIHLGHAGIIRGQALPPNEERKLKAFAGFFYFMLKNRIETSSGYAGCMEISDFVVNEVLEQSKFSDEFRENIVAIAENDPIAYATIEDFMDYGRSHLTRRLIGETLSIVYISIKAQEAVNIATRELEAMNIIDETKRPSAP
ncbi:hypothetical protein HYU09_01795 [Candidatus Woesearchaeota archaeon]|nr:hypothetical protein [Candidatus Woesearchaeota archaeon]